MDSTTQDKLHEYISECLNAIGKDRFFVNNDNTLSTNKTADNLDLIDLMIEYGHEFICSNKYSNFMGVFCNNQNDITDALKLQRAYVKFTNDLGFNFIRKNNVYLHKNDTGFIINMMPQGASQEVKTFVHQMAMVLIMWIDTTESIKFEPIRFMDLGPGDNKKPILRKIRDLSIGLIPPNWFGYISDDFFSILRKKYNFDEIYVTQNGEITLTPYKSSVQLNNCLLNSTEIGKMKIRDNILVFCCN